MTTAALRTEFESFQHFIVNTIDSIVGALDGLSARTRAVASSPGAMS
jgi:hypothetical protein